MEQCHREDGGVRFQDRALHSGLGTGVELRQNVTGWDCSFGERGREHYTVGRYGRGGALRGRPQCLPAAARRE